MTEKSERKEVIKKEGIQKERLYDREEMELIGEIKKITSSKK
jgi:hypothetical protein